MTTFSKDKVHQGDVIRISAVSPKELSRGYKYMKVTAKSESSFWGSILFEHGSRLFFPFDQITSEGKVTFKAQFMQPECTYLLEHCELKDIPLLKRLRIARLLRDQ